MSIPTLSRDEVLARFGSEPVMVWGEHPGGGDYNHGACTLDGPVCDTGFAIKDSHECGWVWPATETYYDTGPDEVVGHYHNAFGDPGTVTLRRAQP
jgi:hypothetical protein